MNRVMICSSYTAVKDSSARTILQERPKQNDYLNLHKCLFFDIDAMLEYAGYYNTNNLVFDICKNKNIYGIYFGTYGLKTLSIESLLRLRLNKISIMSHRDVDHILRGLNTTLKSWGLLSDIIITTNRKAVNKYSSVGVKAFFYSFLPSVSFIDKLKKRFDVVFVGAFRKERAYFFKKIRDAGINIKVWGAGWHNYPELFGGDDEGNIKFIEDGKVERESMSYIYSSAKICLNYPIFSDNTVYLSGRDFESVLCKCLLFTVEAPTLKDYFNIDTDIVLYKGIEDAVSKLKYYLINDKERELICSSAFLRIKSLPDQKVILDNAWESFATCIEKKKKQSIIDTIADVVKRVFLLYHFQSIDFCNTVKFLTEIKNEFGDESFNKALNLLEKDGVSYKDLGGGEMKIDFPNVWDNNLNNWINND